MSTSPIHKIKSSIKCSAAIADTLFFIIMLCGQLPSFAQTKEPYKKLHGGAYTGSLVAGSPDPLVNYHWQTPKMTDSLQVYTLYPKHVTYSPSNHFRQNGDVITVTGNGDLIFDFGVESAGWLEFDCDDLIDSVTASISEYNEPAIVNTGAEHRFKTLTPTKHGNTYRLELNKELYEGVRFAWIHVKKFTRTAHIKNVRLICQAKPVNYKGSFSCSDSLLTRIWYTGAYTVRLNLLQDYFGDILMERSDRHSWTGDAYPAQAAALVAFGNYDMIRQNLQFTSLQDNGIMAYSLYWVLSLIDYYIYTGDSTFIQSLVSNVDNRLQRAFDHYDSLPPLNFMGWDERLGAGFENPQTLEAQRTYRMLCIGVWGKAAKLMESIGEYSLAQKYRHFAELKTKSVLTDKATLHQLGVHSISEAIQAGLGKNPFVKQLAAKIYADRLNRLSYSPFNQYFILQAMSEQQQNQEALTTVKDLWGGQINYGGTSFFEVYRPSWNAVLTKNGAPPNNQCGYTSLCHPWSAGVTKWLSENIAGIKPLSPGFKHFKIVPYLRRDLHWVKGSCPTPQGVIVAEFNSQTGKCVIEVPKGTFCVKATLPKTGKKIEKIRVNGQLLLAKTIHKVEGIDHLEESKDYINLLGLRAGKYEIQITYSGQTSTTEPSKTSVASETPFHYPITNIRQDSLTSGKWIGKYGQKGYFLLGYPKTNPAATGSVSQRPQDVSSIKLNFEKAVHWNLTDQNDLKKHVLERPDKGVGADNWVAAAVATQDPIACRQTMTIDVQLKKEHPYSISVYFLDGDNQGRRTAVELFDFASSDIIAPVVMIEHYAKGKYVRFTYNKSFRIRINQVRGENAVVSGIFFDDPAADQMVKRKTNQQKSRK